MSKKILERKHREEQEATAYAFQEFIKTFQDTTGPPNKTFVKSAILNGATGQEIRSQKGQIYNPQPVIKSISSTTIKNAIECARLIKETKIGRVKGQGKPKTNLEILKEELKLRHLERGEKIKLKDNLTVYSSLNVVNENFDPTTTNLFIAHVNIKTTENDLMQLFGEYGPLASVKIMWPRLDERNRTTNCGFVAFMSRKDAERAMCHLKDVDDMKIGWGKAVELPSHPIYIPPSLLKTSISPPRTGLPFNAQPVQHHFQCHANEAEMQKLLYNTIIKVTIPLDKKVLMMIHRTIEFVIREGPLFEAMIMNKEIDNPTYQFLFDNKTPEHVYYRWKLYSLMQGESYKKWSIKKFRMFKNGSIWSPPVIHDYTKGMPDHLISQSIVFDKSMLSDAQTERFIQLIQTLNMSRKKIVEATMFCLNHVDAAKDVIDIIISSFLNEFTQPPRKIARLYLISDIVYNASIKKYYSSIYREGFEKKLPNVFMQLRVTLKKLTVPTDIEAFTSRVQNVLKSWDLWKIYSNNFLRSLKNICFANCSDIEIENDSIYDKPLDASKLVKNVEGSITIKRPHVAKSHLTMSDFVPSKWELVDPDRVESQAMSTKKFYDLKFEHKKIKEKEKINNAALKSYKKHSQEQRDILRKVEIMVMHYQDDIECGKTKLKCGHSLDNELNTFRDHLLKNLREKNNYINIKKISFENSSNSVPIDEVKNMHKRKTSNTNYELKNKKRLRK